MTTKFSLFFKTASNVGRSKWTDRPSSTPNQEEEEERLRRLGHRVVGREARGTDVECPYLRCVDASSADQSRPPIDPCTTLYTWHCGVVTGWWCKTQKQNYIKWNSLLRSDDIFFTMNAHNLFIAMHLEKVSQYYCCLHFLIFTWEDDATMFFISFSKKIPFFWWVCVAFSLIILCVKGPLPCF